MDAMHPLIVRAVPIGKFILCAEFDNGESRRYDVQQLFDKWPVFRDLERIPGLFSQVRADIGGHGILWNENLDLAAEEIWERGSVV